MPEAADSGLALVFAADEGFVTSDLSPLFDLELGDAPFAAVRDHAIGSTSHQLSGVRQPVVSRPYSAMGAEPLHAMRGQPLKVLASRMLQQRALVWFSGRVAHLVGPASMDDLYRHSSLLTASASAAAEAVLGESVDYGDEYSQVRERLDVRMDSCGRRYPEFCMVEDATACLLYTLVRHAKPSLAVEVGVADGLSTQVILSALDANDSGRLISVDLRNDVGGAARGHPRWSLRVHSPGRSSSHQLRRLLAEVGPPDLFFHDASHTYYDQYAEYLAAWEHMRAGGFFISDDVDWSFAFYDLTTAFSVRPVVLTEGRKAAGLFRRP